MSILKNKFVKILFIILLTITFVLFGIITYVNYNINNILTEKINESYNRSKFSEYYNLKYNKLKVNILTGNLKLLDVKLTHKANSNTNFFEKYGSIDYMVGKVIFKNVDIFKFIKTDSLTIDKIIIKKPTISIQKGSKILKPYNFLNKNNDTTNVLLSLKTFDLQDANLEYHDKNDKINIHSLYILSKNIEITANIYIKSFILKVKDAVQISESVDHINNFSFKNLSVNINNLEINPKHDTSIYTYSNFTINIKKPKFTTKDSLYTFRTNNILIDYKNKNAIVENIIFKPNFSRKRFSKKFKYQTEIYSFDIKKLEITNINFKNLLLEPHLTAENISVNNIIADIYRDKTFPLNTNNYPKYPAQQIQQINIPINIKNINANNISITYSEKISKSKTGKIDISSLNLKIKNITNKTNENNLIIEAKGKVRNKIPFNILVNLDYNKPQFTFKGTVFKSNLRNANKTLSSFEPIELKSGTLNKLTFNGSANNNYSSGNMLFLYNNINIKILDKNKKASTKVKNKVAALVANTVIYKNNPAKGKKTPREVKFKYIRDKNKSFINLIWKSIFSGIIETIHPSKENKKQYKSDLRKNK